MSRMIVARTGGTIDDATKDLAFDSASNYMIILDEVDGTSVEAPLSEVGGGIFEYTHNLGYKPNFYHFQESSAGLWSRPYESGTGGSRSDNNKIYISTSDPIQNVHLIIWANSNDGSIGTGRNNATGRLKIAKSGYSASDTDLRRFVFTSGEGTLIIKEKKSVTVTANTSYDSGYDGYIWNDTVEYAHGLDYVPQVIVFSGGIQIPTSVHLPGLGNYWLDFSVDNQKVYLTFSGATIDNDFDGIEKTFDMQILFNKIA